MKSTLWLLLFWINCEGEKLALKVLKKENLSNLPLRLLGIAALTKQTFWSLKKQRNRNHWLRCPEWRSCRNTWKEYIFTNVPSPSFDRLTDSEEVIREHLRSLRQREGALNVLEKENAELHDKINLLIQENGSITRELEKVKVSAWTLCDWFELELIQKKGYNFRKAKLVEIKSLCICDKKCFVTLYLILASLLLDRRVKSRETTLMHFKVEGLFYCAKTLSYVTSPLRCYYLKWFVLFWPHFHSPKVYLFVQT